MVERYKFIFTFTNGEEETSYFTENPSHRMNDWLDRERNPWIRLENGIINLNNVNVIRLAKVRIHEDTNKEDEILEWI